MRLSQSASPSPTPLDVNLGTISEQDGDKTASADGGGQAARRLSLQDDIPRFGGPLQQVLRLPAGRELPPAIGISSTSDTSATPTPSTTSSSFPNVRNDTQSSRNTSSSPSRTAGDHYSFSSGGGHHDYQHFPSPVPGASSSQTLRRSQPVDPACFATIVGSYDQQPRSAPTVFVVNEAVPPLSGLHVADSNTPELCQHDASPWAASTPDSTYSTPSSDVSRKSARYWLPRNQSPSTEWPPAQLLPHFPSATPPHEAAQSPIPGLDGHPLPQGSTPTMFVNVFTQPTAFGTPPRNQNLAAVPQLPMTAFNSTTEQPACHSAIDGAVPEANFHQQIAQRRDFDPLRSARSPAPPQVTTSQPCGPVAIPPRSTPDDQLSSLTVLARQKELALGVSDPQQVLMAGDGPFNLIGDLGAGLEHDTRERMVVGENAAAAAAGLALDLAITTGCGMPSAASLISLPRDVRDAIPGYIKAYWQGPHRLYPIVHRPSFESSGEDVLRCAMAAVATQYFDGKENRVRGNQLHEFAWQEVKLVTQWSLQTMQAILLCELFARSRGRKAVTKPSKPFESLYSRVSSFQSILKTLRPVRFPSVTYKGSTTQVLNYNPALFHSASTEHQIPPNDRWNSWLDSEARRRLLTACFIADIHASTYQQQRRAHEYDISDAGATPPIPLSARSASLWEAWSATEWAEILTKDPDAGNPTFIPPADTLTPQDLAQRPIFDRAAILSMELLRLPRRLPGGGGGGTANAAAAPATSGPLYFNDPTEDHEQNGKPLIRPHDPQGRRHETDSHTALITSHIPTVPATPVSGPASPALHFPLAEDRLAYLFTTSPRANTYLALHHTPLHSLLAVSGDTWIFSRKVLPAASFLEYQKRLRGWASQHIHPAPATLADGTDSMSAGKATIYAARAILGFLDPSQVGSVGTGTLNTADISDYWGLYACSLICWAFCHRVQKSPEKARAQHQETGPRQDGGQQGVWGEKTVAWLQALASMRRPEEAIRVRGQKEAVGLIGLVRRVLEKDCIGGRCRLYVDAVGVLKKLEEGANRKWF